MMPINRTKKLNRKARDRLSANKFVLIYAQVITLQKIKEKYFGASVSFSFII